MNLTKIERLMLVNQLKILEKLDPENAELFKNNIKALEEGYVLHYADAFEGLWDELSEGGCKEVIDILVQRI